MANTPARTPAEGLRGNARREGEGPSREAHIPETISHPIEAFERMVVAMAAQDFIAAEKARRELRRLGFSVVLLGKDFRPR